MTLLQKTLLITCCISFPLYAMEKEQAPSTNTNSHIIKSNNSNFYAIDKLYKEASSLLDNYQPATSTTILALSTIIKKTEEYNNTMAKDLGLFAFKQKPLLWVATNPYYTSVFFARLTAYHAELKRKNLSSPTIEELASGNSNKNITSGLDLCTKIDIPINKKQKQYVNEKLMINLPNSIALDEFEKLKNDIDTMLSASLATVEATARTIYGADIEEK